MQRVEIGQKRESKSIVFGKNAAHLKEMLTEIRRLEGLYLSVTARFIVL